MSETRQLIVNGRAVEAHVGETLVDAALGGWVIIPHDCRSGQCETCRVQVVSGIIDDQGTGDGRSVLACQAKIVGDAEIKFDEMPAATKHAGIVTEITALSHDVVEVVVALQSTLEFRPGHYVHLKFSGFPVREYSPTRRLDGTLDPHELVFHVRRIAGGVLSSQIGATIRTGHRVTVTGPFGQAFLREGSGPLILIAGGTGWAPIWTIAREARLNQRSRELTVIVGNRDPGGLYMGASLDWLIDDGVRDIFVTVETEAARPVLPGLPTHYLPLLGIEDIVHVAGPSGLVNAVKRKARAGFARCYADPFVASTKTPSLFDRVMGMLRSPAPAGNPLSPRPAGFGDLLQPASSRRANDRDDAPVVPRADEAAQPGKRRQFSD